MYRQDVVGTPVPEPPPEPKADGKPKADDRTTLILHPAPKAAPRKRSHDSRRPKTAKEALKARLAKRTGGQKPQKQASVSETPELQEAWFDVDATKVAATIAEAGAAGEALVKAWLERNNTVAIAAAAQLDGIAGSARKAARRALGVLKSRGVEIPDFGATAEPVAKQAEPVIASFVPPDASGMEFFSISQRQPGGRYHVADVVVREPLGIMHASSGRIAGKHIREWRTRVEERFGTAPVDVPLAWARFRFAEARKLNATSKQLLPLGVDKCAELFEPQEDTVPDHPVAELEGGIDADAAKAASATSELLHQDPEFRSWLPDKPALDEMLGKIGERVGRDNAEDKDLVDEVLKEEIAAATDRFFSPEIREVIANRMRDSAISIRERAGGERAIQVLAVAKAVREAGLITSPPSEIPFLLSFFKKGVAIMAQQGAGKIQVPMPG